MVTIKLVLFLFILDSDLRNELCKLKVSLQEKEGTFAKELKSMIKKYNDLNEKMKNNEEQHQSHTLNLKETHTMRSEATVNLFYGFVSKIADQLSIARPENVRNESEMDEFLENIRSFVAGKEEYAKNQEKFTAELQNDLDQKKEALLFYQSKYNSLENERKDLINRAVITKKVNTA